MAPPKQTGYVNATATIVSLISKVAGDPTANKMIFENYTLYPGLSAYRWTGFELLGDTSVRLNSQADFAGVRILSEKKLTFNNSEIVLTTVSFKAPDDTDDAQGFIKIVLNEITPSQENSVLTAILESGVRSLGMKSGWIRVVDVKVTPDKILANLEYR